MIELTLSRAAQSEMAHYLNQLGIELANMDERDAELSKRVDAIRRQKAIIELRIKRVADTLASLIDPFTPLPRVERCVMAKWTCEYADQVLGALSADQLDPDNVI